MRTGIYGNVYRHRDDYGFRRLGIFNSLKLEYDATVRADIEAFRAQAENRIAGRTTDDELRPHRLRRGIYGQRQPDVQMIRTKIPGGLMTSDQLRQLARVADEFARKSPPHHSPEHSVSFVPLGQVSDLLHMLADVRLTTREACYNTVRNITACPSPGSIPKKLSSPALRATPGVRIPAQGNDRQSAAQIQNRLSAARKIDGDRDQRRRPTRRHPRRSRRFPHDRCRRPGPLPTEARLLHEFIPGSELVHRVEAVIRIFSMHGNRKNKNKARLKFVLRERGSNGSAKRSKRSIRTY